MKHDTDTKADTDARAEPPRRTSLQRTWLWVFLGGTLVAGMGFAFKLYEFFWALAGTEGFEFAGVHLITYGLVASGFLLLLVHGVMSGHFASIEEPKFELLEREERYDHDEYDR